ncbi:hypothetical protein KUV80_08080 [Fictibacillus nanhaiensis]|uniref:DUF5700 domain-containing putative Zn-dependent protease n=1 Tax=Fictibacillus nanhaiensis TaxID=742169 RepID=UPI001C97A000|nr:DUF5700 domain-containing putative Zn-dependent protease [Fictibacillus nanhaiensis]MBY6036607.1 hypothetical protein [Fictibacillus nanhaiensis]
MKIIDTVSYFTSNFHPSLEFLKSYYEKYPQIFQEYFTYHCKNTEERLNLSIAKYSECFSLIRQVHEAIIPIIKEVSEEYYRLYQITFPVDINLIVGGFGSNAYTHRQIIPNITFALEKLSPDPDHLKTIVAHEFGHAAQNIISNEAGMDWSKLKWNNPLTWLNQEGAATHFSRQTAVNLHPSIYFSFNGEGYDWLTFAVKNKKEIFEEFAKDYANLSPQSLFQEWFSINGGKKFGYSRLAYYVGDQFFQYQINRLGELNAVIAWKEEEFEGQIKEWIDQKSVASGI